MTEGIKWWLVVNYFAAYFTVCIIGFSVAIVELLSKYGAGNKPSWVLLGRSQSVYYITNICAAIVVLFIAEATDRTKIVDLFSTKPGLAVVEAAKIGIISMFALRSSLYSVEKKDQKIKVDFGPAQILTVINRYLERQMDQSRGQRALKEVAEIFKNNDPNLMELTSLCLNVPESISKEDMIRLRKEVDLLQKEKSVSQKVRAINMGIQLQREVGTALLHQAVKILKEQSQVSVQSPGTFGLGTQSTLSTGSVVETPASLPVAQPENDVLSLEDQLDQELDKQLEELSSEHENQNSKPRGES